MRMSKHSSCLIHRNFLVGISYSDATPGQSFAYDHLGNLTQITDAAGTRTFAYNPYGEPETDSLAANGIAWQVSERYDGLGRQAGYELSADGRRVQQTHLSYDGKGRLSTLTAEGMETPFSWTYSEQGGLVEQLAYPNGMTRVNTYEDSRDLLSVIDYQRPGSANPPARHEYDYDALGRPARRRDTWNTAAPKTTRLFTYNSRGELVGDQLRPGGRFGYQYDNIGNRKEAFEFGSATDYETDELNRYAGIVRNGGEAFTPQYDADGNQTLVKTSTGIWEVTYNAENRPVKFESEDGGTTVECAYDSMGRRFEKKVTVGGTTGFHARYLYRDYLQVAECDLTGETPVVVRSYIWDPSEPEATRVLSMTRWEANGTQEKEHLYCMHDAMKNVTSLFGEARGRRALYEYRPYGGLITSEGNMAEENKFRFSSEYMDDELGLVYYNYRHLNPLDGRWISRDPIEEEGGWNLFAFVNNNGIINIDLVGLIDGGMGGIINGTYGSSPFNVSYKSNPNYSPSNNGKNNVGFPIKGNVSIKVENIIEKSNPLVFVVAVEVERTGALRVDYDKIVQKLELSGFSREEASKVRDSIKLEFRKKQTILGKAITELILNQRKSNGFVDKKSNPSKTNPKVTVAGKIMKHGGRGIILFSAGIEIYTIWNTPIDQRERAILQSGGRFGGGILGGAASGAVLGSYGFNAVTVAIGAFLGAVAGSETGEWIINKICK